MILYEKKKKIKKQKWSKAGEARQKFDYWKKSLDGRNFILRRYKNNNGECELCWCKLKKPFHNTDKNEPGAVLTVDHIRNLDRGGSPTDPNNMRIVCANCNSKRNKRKKYYETHIIVTQKDRTEKKDYFGMFDMMSDEMDM